MDLETTAYPSRSAARRALVEAGYHQWHTRDGPIKWVLDSSALAVYGGGSEWRIVAYPNLGWLEE